MRAWGIAMFVLAGCTAAAPQPAHTLGSAKQAHRQCAAASDCILVPRTCCGQCEQPASGDVRAIPSANAAADRERRCHGGGCGDCYQDADPLLVATCSRAGVCGVLDLHTSPLTRCNADADCTVRPRDCCECGATAWVAINGHSDAAYARGVCGAATACPECVGQRPSTIATCQSHHCAFVAETAAAPPPSIDDLLVGGS